MYTFEWCLFLASVTAVVVSSVTGASSSLKTYQQLSDSHVQLSNQAQSENVLPRVRRQSSRRPGVFTLFGQLITQTANETNSAYRQISQLISESFGSNNSTPPTNQDLTADSPASSATSSNSSISIVDPSSSESVSTTSAPYRASRNELMTILRRNLLGLRNLLMKEWRTAIEDTNKNVAETGKQFRAAIRPFIVGSNSTKR